MRVHADRLNACFDLPRASPYIAAYQIRNNYLAEVYISKYTDKGRKSEVEGNFFIFSTCTKSLSQSVMNKNFSIHLILDENLADYH